MPGLDSESLLRLLLVAEPACLSARELRQPLAALAPFHWHYHWHRVIRRALALADTRGGTAAMAVTAVTVPVVLLVT